MKILVTGANGYVGSSICKHLPYNIVKLTRDVVDLTNQTKVDEWFKDKRFDVVIHCATAGGLRTQQDTSDVTHQNLQMFYNLLRNKKSYKKLINIGSGAEFDRSQNIAPIWTEDGNCFPTDPYGMSKSIISKLVENEEYFYNVRVFGLFDENELETRFIKSNIKRYINKEPLIIHQNKYMDFIYIEDLILLVKYIIQNPDVKVIDANYVQPYTLKDIALLINELDNHQCEVIIKENNLGKPYVGSLNEIKLPYIGLEKGIKKVYEALN